MATNLFYCFRKVRQLQKSEFLNELFQNSSGYINIREIDNGGKVKQHFLTLEEANNYKWPDDRHVYFGVYTRQKGNGKANGCISTGALWADFDNMQLQEVKHRIREAGLPEASIYVFSGGGIHTYWLLKERAKNGITGVLRAIAAATGADIKATDTARIMRLPESLNIKYKPFKQCKIIEATWRRYPLSLFETILGVQSESEKKTPVNIIADRPCIDTILKGVPEGERNFALGRLVKWLQLKGYTQRESQKIILEWNSLNNPPEAKGKLLNDFNSYWHGDYKLLGCAIENPEIQQLLYKYCNRPECKFTMAIGSIKLDNTVKYNNRLLDRLHMLTGNELIIYGLLMRHSEGLSTSLLTEKLTTATGESCISKPTRLKSLNTLKKMGFIEVIRGNRREGKENFYKAIPQGTYGLGYTLVSNGAINGAIDKRVTAGELKLYVLLLKYAFSKGACYPSLSTLAKELRTTPNNVSILLNRLEKADYIKREYKLFNGVEKLDIKLLV